jgi:hypothetical protein
VDPDVWEDVEEEGTTQHKNPISARQLHDISRSKCTVSNNHSAEYILKQTTRVIIHVQAFASLKKIGKYFPKLASNDRRMDVFVSADSLSTDSLSPTHCPRLTVPDSLSPDSLSTY